jgi:hypothetical protein
VTTGQTDTSAANAGGDDLLAMLEPATPTRQPVIATFKSTRVVNLHTVETLGKRRLDFRISHRFGRLNSGPYELFGLDQAYIRLGLEYGLTDRIALGVGRSNSKKYYDGFVKWKFLRQTTGPNAMPLSAVLFLNAGCNSTRFPSGIEGYVFSHRLAYTAQLILARKFGERLSLQLSPTFLHRNLVPTALDENQVWALGASGRFKLTKRLAINAEYIWLAPGHTADTYRNTLSLGFDIETGGHVFSLHLSNSVQMVEQGFIPETTGNWLKGDIHFGFNISRSFSLGSGRRRTGSAE